MLIIQYECEYRDKDGIGHNLRPIIPHEVRRWIELNYPDNLWDGKGENRKKFIDRICKEFDMAPGDADWCITFTLT